MGNTGGLMTTWSSLSQRFRKTRPTLGWDAKANEIILSHLLVVNKYVQV